jgi:hypothetical protein
MEEKIISISHKEALNQSNQLEIDLDYKLSVQLS